MKFAQIPFLLMCVISLFTVVSCNEKDGDVTPKMLRKLDKATISDGTYRHYTYDAQGRCLRIDYKDRSTTFSYGTAGVVEITTFVDPTKSTPVLSYILNSKGLAATKRYTSGTSTYLTDYEYDANGRLIREVNKYTTSTGVTYTSSTSISTYDSDGDLVLVESQSPSSASSSYTVRYEIDKSQYNTINFEFTGLEWRGKPHTMPLKRW